MSVFTEYNLFQKSSNEDDIYVEIDDEDVNLFQRGEDKKIDIIVIQKKDIKDLGNILKEISKEI